jgi:hypothetical protein
MSMIGNFLAVTAEKLNELVRDPATVAEFLEIAIEDQDELGADFLDVDKSWQAIHFLLTGDEGRVARESRVETGSVHEGESPLRWVVFAPTEIGEDSGYGLPRALTADQVVEVSKALAPITADKLRKKCDLKLMNDREIYPQGWRAGDEDYVAENFAHLKKLYESAARRRLGVVQWLS